MNLAKTHTCHLTMKCHRLYTKENNNKHLLIGLQTKPVNTAIGTSNRGVKCLSRHNAFKILTQFSERNGKSTHSFHCVLFANFKKFPMSSLLEGNKVYNAVNKAFTQIQTVPFSPVDVYHWRYLFVFDLTKANVLMIFSTLSSILSTYFWHRCIFA